MGLVLACEGCTCSNGTDCKSRKRDGSIVYENHLMRKAAEHISSTRKRSNSDMNNNMNRQLRDYCSDMMYNSADEETVSIAPSMPEILEEEDDFILVEDPIVESPPQNLVPANSVVESDDSSINSEDLPEIERCNPEIIRESKLFRVGTNTPWNNETMHDMALAMQKQMATMATQSASPMFDEREEDAPLGIYYEDEEMDSDSYNEFIKRTGLQPVQVVESDDSSINSEELGEIERHKTECNPEIIRESKLFRADTTTPWNNETMDDMTVAIEKQMAAMVATQSASLVFDEREEGVPLGIYEDEEMYSDSGVEFIKRTGLQPLQADDTMIPQSQLLRMESTGKWGQKRLEEENNDMPAQMLRKPYAVISII